MTREELKKHCLKQIEGCEMWARHNGEEPHGKVYEEHKLILELLDPEPCGDAISRQAALDAISRIGMYKCSTKEVEAVSECLRAVEALLPVTPQYTNKEIQKMQDLEQAEIEKAYELGKTEIQPCDDCISRQAVLDGLASIAKAKSDSQKALMGRVMFFTEQLPPVTPQPKTGHWFIDERPESDRETICSNCEQPIFKYHKLDFDYRPKYCPNCGTKMVEPQKSEG